MTAIFHILDEIIGIKKLYISHIYFDTQIFQIGFFKRNNKLAIIFLDTLGI